MSDTDIKENRLTGPEYELLYNLLNDIVDFKIKNEKNDKVPAFVRRICDSDIKKLISKMGRRMDEFDPHYRHTCW